MVSDEAEHGQDLDGEEVRGGDGTPMGGEEGLPRHGEAALRSWDDAEAIEDTFDSVAADRDTQIGQGPLDPGVAPGWVFVGHGGDEAGDIGLGVWPAWPAIGRPVVFPGDEVAIPAEQGVRGDDPGDLFQATSSQSLSLEGESTSLVVREPEPSAWDVLTQDPILLLEILNLSLLMSIDPPRREEDNEAQEIWHGREDSRIWRMRDRAWW